MGFYALLPSSACFLGFHCEDHENPADFFLDTLNKSEREQDTVIYSQQSVQGIEEANCSCMHPVHAALKTLATKHTLCK